jgi:hypothetical protein
LGTGFRVELAEYVELPPVLGLSGPVRACVDLKSNRQKRGVGKDSRKYLPLISRMARINFFSGMLGWRALVRKRSARYGRGMTAASRWSAVDYMVDFHTRDKRLGLLTETLAWVASVAFFRETEAETHYFNVPSTDDRRQHRTILAALIAEGERLLRRIHGASGLPASLDGIESADVDALVEELRTTRLQWEGDMTPERRAEILKSLFDVAPS